MQISNQFLNYRPESKTIYFDSRERGFDTEKNFRKNRKRLLESWEYYDKKITYELNEKGFRTKSFDNIKWEESIIVFGCSKTFGTGLAEEDTVTFQLEKKINIPVINLGISGSAIDLAVINSLILHENYPKPKAIVQLWTNESRYTDFNRLNVTPYQAQDARYYDKLDWAERSKFYVLSDRALWRNKLLYYEASWFEETAKIFKVDFLETVDTGRDLSHPGKTSAQHAAEKIAIGLKFKEL